MWQEIAFSVGSVLFALALLPSVLSEHKPEWHTSLLTASVLTVYVVAFWTMQQPYAAGTGAVTAALWWTLFVQEVR